MEVTKIVGKKIYNHYTEIKKNFIVLLHAVLPNNWLSISIDSCFSC